jgi:hypothetical protein
MGHAAEHVKLNIEIFLQFSFRADQHGVRVAVVFIFASQFGGTLDEEALGTALFIRRSQ